MGKMKYVEPNDYFTPSMRKILERGETGKTENKTKTTTTKSNTKPATKKSK